MIIIVAIEMMKHGNRNEKPSQICSYVFVRLAMTHDDTSPITQNVKVWAFYCIVILCKVDLHDQGFVWHMYDIRDDLWHSLYYCLYLTHHPRFGFVIIQCNNFGHVIKWKIWLVMITWTGCELEMPTTAWGITRLNPSLHLDGEIDELHRVCKGTFHFV